MARPGKASRNHIEKVYSDEPQPRYKFHNSLVLYVWIVIEKYYDLSCKLFERQAEYAHSS